VLSVLTNTKWLYRLEWLAVAILAIALLIGQLEWGAANTVWRVVFFAIMPDLALLTFPLAKDGASWPYALYNTLHSIVIWAAVMGANLIFGWGMEWILMPWLAHIAIDRALGFTLRDGRGTIVGFADGRQIG
jgi:Domain of unknown function (DUF4260)